MNVKLLVHHVARLIIRPLLQTCSKQKQEATPNSYPTLTLLNAELNPIRHLLALVGARHIVHVSRIRVNANGFSNKKTAKRYIHTTDNITTAYPFGKETRKKQQAVIPDRAAVLIVWHSAVTNAAAKPADNIGQQLQHDAATSCTRCKPFVSHVEGHELHL